ncbi:hypothetical protein [Peptostreptococcus faecalis]|uniref:hypothetical protein n=1 Tax=Peptostreptococcus faecalis TaxID=2045015 RepID=UPI000C79FB8D|nr:hypothetical protein [Peptostreptococcus faecalis]
MNELHNLIEKFYKKEEEKRNDLIKKKQSHIIILLGISIIINFIIENIIQRFGGLNIIIDIYQLPLHSIVITLFLIFFLNYIFKTHKFLKGEKYIQIQTKGVYEKYKELEKIHGEENLELVKKMYKVDMENMLECIKYNGKVNSDKNNEYNKAQKSLLWLIYITIIIIIASFSI